MFTIHHLGRSQSERIVWLCEELGLPYVLKHYARDPVTRLSPPELKELHPLGAAPLLEDDGLLLAESAAIVEYITVKYAQGRLRCAPEDPGYADFLYWFHFSNGNLQPILLRLLTVSHMGVGTDHRAVISTRARLDLALSLVEKQLSQTPYLAGESFSAADVMTVFSLTTMRLFQPVDLAGYPAIRAYLARIGERPAYRRAMAKSDPDFTPLLQ